MLSKSRWLGVLALWLGLVGSGQAQKVGLVLSGGGAKGLAHVGVLRVLEKNRIPIDYIIGTSMGAVVGGMYAAGYSPDEIERIVLSSDFQYWVSGKQLEDKTFNYLNADPSPEALRVSVAVDSALHTRLTPNLINDVNLNLALAKFLAPAGAVSDYDFDKLFVPFRCLAAEVFTRQQVVQRNGSLADAVRNSMAVPLVFRPIRNPDGRYLFDGGIYNNFPTDVMREEFQPDVIIGVNVGDVAYKKYPFKKDDELLAGTLVFLGANVADTLSVGKNGVFIQPDLEGFGATDFEKVGTLLKRGAQATEQKLPQLLARIQRRVDTVALAQRRAAFQERAPRPVFNAISVQGLKKNQDDYVRSFFRRTGRNYSIGDISDGYYRLATNDFFRNIYPRIHYDPQQGYSFNLDARQSNNLSASIGFLLSTRPIDNIYLGLEYRFLKRFMYSTSLNGNLGRFYNAGQARFRIGIPCKVPLYIEPGVTFNQWNYQKTGGILNRDIQNTLIEQRDFAAMLQLGVSPKFRSRLTLEGGYFNNQDRYTNLAEANSGTTLDRTYFHGGTAALRFARNSLNRKQYPTTGRRAITSLRGVWGQEQFVPGSTSVFTDDITAPHRWVQLSGIYEQFYAFRSHHSSWGYYGSFMLSGQGLFANYRSSLTTAPVFAPLVDSRTLFLDNYRAPYYAAGGLRYSHDVVGKLEWRTEVFTHLVYQPLREGANQQAYRATGFAPLRLTASTGLIYDTPIGPLAVHLIHYDDSTRRWAVFGHIGYLLFHGRSLE